MEIGYARVSTKDQNNQSQIDTLTKHGCEEVFTDIASGAKTERPGLNDAISFCRGGDTLVVCRLDRLGRSMSHLIETVTALEKRNIEFKSLTEDINTKSPSGKLIFHLFGTLAEFELSIIKERVQAGLKAARSRGRIGGRPGVSKETKLMAQALMKDKSIPVKQICDQLGIAKSTLYKYAKSS